jgi:hypothetical protein
MLPADKTSGVTFDNFIGELEGEPGWDGPSRRLALLDADKKAHFAGWRSRR